MTDDQPAPLPNPTGRQEPRLEHLDPRILRTATNVRTDLRLDREFVDSVRQHGILQPVVGHRGADGAVTIAYGHRRAAAAVEMGLPTIPTLVHDMDSPAVSGADRVLAQVVENDHRAGLSTAERVGAYGQLAAFGLSPTQIARRSSTRKAEVDRALKVAASDLAAAATARYDLTLGQAVVLSDFEQDKEAVTALVAGAKTGQFEHVAQRLRDQRHFQQAVTDLTTRLAGDGVTVLADRPDTAARRGTTRRLDELAHDGEPLDPEQHQACPGHAAYLERSWGEELVQPVLVCRDPRGNGHIDRHRQSAAADAGAGPGAALSEAERAERRQVRQNNTDWRSAETVRRDFLRQLLGRKTPPTGARRFLAESLVAGHHALRRALERGHPLARDLLDLDPAGDGLTTTLEAASDTRAEVIALGVVLAAYEDATDVHTWRNPDTATRGYLDFLRCTGYQLSPLEQAVASPSAPTAVTDAAAAPSTPRQRSKPRTGGWAPARQGAMSVDPDRPPPTAA